MDPGLLAESGRGDEVGGIDGGKIAASDLAQVLRGHGVEAVGLRDAATDQDAGR